MVRTIYISWRKKKGERRYIIGRLKKNVDGIIFEPMEDFVRAKENGLEYFFDFSTSRRFSSKEIENLLLLRVISRERPDSYDFLKFWEADKVKDTFDLLALTQGKSPTDNFEFLADYLTVKEENFSFVTDIAGLSHLNVPVGMIKKDDVLNYKKEPNEFDKSAIAVYKNDFKIGYIKKIHNKIFGQLKRKLKVTVKAIDENGRVKQIFIKVEK